MASGFYLKALVGPSYHNTHINKLCSCHAYYMRDSDSWHKIDYTVETEIWMKPLRKGNETGPCLHSCKLVRAFSNSRFQIQICFSLSTWTIFHHDVRFLNLTILMSPLRNNFPFISYMSLLISASRLTREKLNNFGKICSPITTGEKN